MSPRIYVYPTINGEPYSTPGRAGIVPIHRVEVVDIGDWFPHLVFREGAGLAYHNLWIDAYDAIHAAGFEVAT